MVGVAYSGVDHELNSLIRVFYSVWVFLSRCWEHTYSVYTML